MGTHICMLSYCSKINPRNSKKRQSEETVAQLTLPEIDFRVIKKKSQKLDEEIISYDYLWLQLLNPKNICSSG